MNHKLSIAARSVINYRITEGEFTVRLTKSRNQIGFGHPGMELSDLLAVRALWRGHLRMLLTTCLGQNFFHLHVPFSRCRIQRGHAIVRPEIDLGPFSQQCLDYVAVAVVGR